MPTPAFHAPSSRPRSLRGSPRRRGPASGGRAQGDRRNPLALLLVSGALLLAGCSTTAEVRPAERARLEPPQQPAESIRLVVYRPQTLVGMAGRPVVVVNDRRMGIEGSPVNENFLQPGSVFVVDAPAALTQVRWLQSKQARPSDDVITYKDLPGATRYLRWTLKPTYGYLQEVGESVALEEIGPLRYSGYLNLSSPR
jgi:hypothetical protein